MTMMQRRHYEFIASTMAAMQEAAHMDDATHTAACVFMASQLAATNPQFSRERFLIACGVRGEAD